MLLLLHTRKRGSPTVGIGDALRRTAAVHGRWLLHQFAESPQPQSSPPPPDLLAQLDLEPRVDKRPSRNEDALIQDFQKSVPNVPVQFWNKVKNRPMFYKNESCAKFPSIFELEFNNIYWQTLRTSNGTFQLYGAYYDIRNMSRIGPAVRILGMINRIEPTVKTFCQLWFDSIKEPVFIHTLEYKYIWYRKWGNYKQGIYQPYLIACQIPRKYHKLVPSSVSLVEKVCDQATNNLRVIYDRPSVKKGFAVCVKVLN